MTALQHAPDVETLEHLDEAWDIACECHDGADRRLCGAHADWWVICRECGRSIAECDRHRVEQHLLWTSAPGSVYCERCQAEVDVQRWRDLFTVTPIEGRP